MILGTSVCRERCIVGDKQAIPVSVCAERCFRTMSFGQGIHRFLPKIVVDDGDLKIIY